VLHRRTILALAPACAVAAALPGRAEEPSRLAPAPDMRRILERGRLLVALVAGEVPPFVTATGDGGIGGCDGDLARGMAASLGVALAVDRSARSADELVALVARGGVDLGLSRLSATLQRAVAVRFSRPYLVLRQALLVSRPRFARLAPGQEPLELAAAPAAVIGIRAGSGYDEYAARTLPQARLRRYSRWDPELLDAVLDGEVLAGFGDEIEVQRSLGLRPDAPLLLRAVLLPESRDPIAVALPWDSAQLRAWVDLYLAEAIAPLTAEALLGAPKPLVPPQ
jgi:polar amino acid transport system substrate-binding protein